MYIWKTELTEKTATSVCFLQTETETANFCLFAANGNGKRKFVFLGRQTINSRYLMVLFQ